MSSKELRLYLTPEHWEVFDRACERQESYRGRLASQIVAAWCQDHEQVTKSARASLIAGAKALGLTTEGEE